MVCVPFGHAVMADGSVSTSSDNGSLENTTVELFSIKHDDPELENFLLKVAPYGYSLFFVLRALVSTILGNLPITLSRTSLEPIEIKFWEIKLPF